MQRRVRFLATPRPWARNLLPCGSSRHIYFHLQTTVGDEGLPFATHLLFERHALLGGCFGHRLGQRRAVQVLPEKIGRRGQAQRLGLGPDVDLTKARIAHKFRDVGGIVQ